MCSVLCADSLIGHTARNREEDGAKEDGKWAVTGSGGGLSSEDMSMRLKGEGWAMLTG